MSLETSKQLELLSERDLENVVGGSNDEEKSKSKKWEWDSLDKQQKITYGLCGGAMALSGVALIVCVGGTIYNIIKNKLKSE